jgi:hypothetical protein
MCHTMGKAYRLGGWLVGSTGCSTVSPTSSLFIYFLKFFFSTYIESTDWREDWEEDWREVGSWGASRKGRMGERRGNSREELHWGRGMERF